MRASFDMREQPSQPPREAGRGAHLHPPCSAHAHCGMPAPADQASFLGVPQLCTSICCAPTHCPTPPSPCPLSRTPRVPPSQTAVQPKHPRVREHYCSSGGLYDAGAWHSLSLGTCDLHHTPSPSPHTITFTTHRRFRHVAPNPLLLHPVPITRTKSTVQTSQIHPIPVFIREQGRNTVYGWPDPVGFSRWR